MPGCGFYSNTSIPCSGFLFASLTQTTSCLMGHPVLFEYIIWKSVKFEFFYKISVCLDERGPAAYKPDTYGEYYGEIDFNRVPYICYQTIEGWGPSTVIYQQLY